MAENQSNNTESRNALTKLLSKVLKDSEDSGQLTTTKQSKMRKVLKFVTVNHDKMLKTIVCRWAEMEMIAHILQPIIDENPEIKTALQKLFTVLLKAILDLPELNCVTKMLIKVYNEGQDDIFKYIELVEYNIMIPIILKYLHPLISTRVVLYPLIKNVCDNYPKWLEDNDRHLDKEEFYKHAYMFEITKEIRGYYEDQQDVNNDKSIKKKERKKIENLFKEISINCLSIPLIDLCK